MATWIVTPVGQGGDYSSLAAALSNANTTAGDTIEIQGDWTGISDNTPAIVNDDNITIRATGTARTIVNEVVGGECYRLIVASNHCLVVNNAGCTIDGIFIRQNGTGNSDECIRHNGPGTLRVTNCVIRANLNRENQDGIFINTSVNRTLEVENCALYEFGRAGIYIQNNGSNATQDIKVISCTFFFCGRFVNGSNGAFGGGGIVAFATTGKTTNVQVHNCIAVNNTGGHASYEDFMNRSGATGTITWQIDNVICSDTSASARDSGGTNQVENATWTDGTPGAGNVVAFIEITSRPFNLSLQDDANNTPQDQHASATGAGLTIGDFSSPAADIVGTTRPQNTNYDLGYFEVPSGAPPAVAIEFAGDGGFDVTTGLGPVDIAVDFDGLGGFEVTATSDEIDYAVNFDGLGTFELTPELGPVEQQVEFAGAGGLDITTTLGPVDVSVQFDGMGAFLIGTTLEVMTEFDGVGGMEVTATLGDVDLEIEFAGAGGFEVTAVAGPVDIAPVFNGFGTMEVTAVAGPVNMAFDFNGTSTFEVVSTIGPIDLVSVFDGTSTFEIAGFDVIADDVDHLLPGLEAVNYSAPQFERAVVDFSGLSALGQSSRPTFRAYATQDRPVNADTETLIRFDTKGWDYGRLNEEGGQEGAFDVADDRMTAQVSGIYGLHFNATMEAATTHKVEFRIYVREVGQPSFVLRFTDKRMTEANDQISASFARELYLNSGDTVELRVFSVGQQVTIKDDRDWTGRLVNR